MNTSYIGMVKPMEIMYNSLEEKENQHASEVPVILSEQLLNKFFDEHYSFLCQIAMNVIDDVEASKDIVQSFFLYCWEKKSGLKIQGNLKSYAYRSVRNSSLNYLKRMTKVNYDSEYIFTEAVKIPQDSEKERHAIEDRREKMLWDTIAQMPDKRKEIFLLSQREGLTYIQIAKNLDISVNTVKTHIKLAYVFLRSECKWLMIVIGWLLI